jgi:hypothetical protein
MINRQVDSTSNRAWIPQLRERVRVKGVTLPRLGGRIGTVQHIAAEGRRNRYVVLLDPPPPHSDVWISQSRFAATELEPLDATAH